MALIYDSSHSGQEIDAAVDAVQTTIPSQLTQIGLKLGDLANLETTDKSSLVSAVNDVNSKAAANKADILVNSKLIAYLSSKLENWCLVDVDGIYFIDENNNVGAYINAGGAAGFGVGGGGGSASLENTYPVEENGMFFVDEAGNIGAFITASGIEGFSNYIYTEGEVLYDV